MSTAGQWNKMASDCTVDIEVILKNGRTVSFKVDQAFAKCAVTKEFLLQACQQFEYNVTTEDFEDATIIFTNEMENESQLPPGSENESEPALPSKSDHQLPPVSESQPPVNPKSEPQPVFESQPQPVFESQPQPVESQAQLADSEGPVPFAYFAQDYNDPEFQWTTIAVKILISTYKELQCKFNCMGIRKRQAWGMVAAAMKKEGFSVTGLQCDKKMRSLRHRYKVIKDKKQKGQESRSKWEFWEDMEEMMTEGADEDASFFINDMSGRLTAAAMGEGSAGEEGWKSSQELLQERTAEESSSAVSKMSATPFIKVVTLNSAEGSYLVETSKDSAPASQTGTSSNTSHESPPGYSLRFQGPYWSTPSVKCLIATYKGLQDRFNSPEMKKWEAWEMVARAMRSRGFPVTGVQCDDKMRNLKFRHKQINEKLQSSGKKEQVRWLYLDDMNDLMSGKPAAEPVSLVKVINAPVSSDVGEANLSAEETNRGKELQDRAAEKVTAAANGTKEDVRPVALHIRRDSMQEEQSTESALLDNPEDATNDGADIPASTTGAQWSYCAVKCLMATYKEMEEEFHRNKKKVAWEMVAGAMKTKGFQVTGLQADDKFRNLKLRHRLILDKLRKRGRGAHSEWKYMSDMNDLMGTAQSGEPEVQPVTHISVHNNAIRNSDVGDGNDNRDYEPSRKQHDQKPQEGMAENRQVSASGTSMQYSSLQEMSEENAASWSEADEDVGSPSGMSASTGELGSSAAVKALIATYRSLQDKFKCPDLKKKQAWKMVAAAMRRKGFQVNGLQCDNKMRCLRFRHRQRVRKRKKYGSRALRYWKHMEDMDALVAGEGGKPVTGTHISGASTDSDAADYDDYDDDESSKTQHQDRSHELQVGAEETREWVPSKTTLMPVKTSSNPPKTTLIPVKTSFIPAKTSLTPAKTSLVPAKTSLVPSRSRLISILPQALKKCPGEGGNLGETSKDPELAVDSESSRHGNTKHEPKMPVSGGLWSPRAAKCLLAVYRALQTKFHNPAVSKTRAWHLVAQAMRRKGHPVSARLCDAKMRNLRFRYKQIMKKSKKGLRSWELLADMHDVMQREREAKRAALMVRPVALNPPEGSRDAASVPSGDSTIDDNPESSQYAGAHWSSVAVKYLIATYRALQSKFHDPLIMKRDAWEMVARILKNKGFPVTGSQCDEKMRAMKFRHKVITSKREMGEEHRTRWEHLKDMDDLMAGLLRSEEATPLTDSYLGMGGRDVSAQDSAGAESWNHGSEVSQGGTVGYSDAIGAKTTTTTSLVRPLALNPNSGTKPEGKSIYREAVRQLVIDGETYRQWHQLRMNQNIRSDSHMAAFLLQFYEKFRPQEELGLCCVSCQRPRPLVCSLCQPPQQEGNVTIPQGQVTGQQLRQPLCCSEGMVDRGSNEEEFQNSDLSSLEDGVISFQGVDSSVFREIGPATSARNLPSLSQDTALFTNLNPVTQDRMQAGNFAFLRHGEQHQAGTAAIPPSSWEQLQAQTAATHTMATNHPPLQPVCEIRTTGETYPVKLFQVDDPDQVSVGAMFTNCVRESQLLLLQEPAVQGESLAAAESTQLPELGGFQLGSDGEDAGTLTMDGAVGGVSGEVEVDISEEIQRDVLASMDVTMAEMSKVYDSRKVRRYRTPRRSWGPPPYLCQECGMSFSKSSHFMLHTYKHTGEYPYPCTECDAAFVTRTRLRNHFRKHTGEKPFLCTICGMAFRQSGILETHMRTHTGEKPYKCSYCPAGFSTSSARTRHHRMHTGEKPYICRQCNAAFIDLQMLKVHEFRHKGIRPFQCPKCGLSFYRKCGLRRHMLRVQCTK